MAVRLNVMILGPSGGSHFQSQCDDCIGQLLGRPGLDVTLLERLPQKGDQSTESLALESIGGHIACLSWQDPDSLLSALEKAGKPMLRRPHTHDPNPPLVDPSSEDASSPRGRMFLFDMRQPDATKTILSSLQTLLKLLQVPMFQIAPGPGAKPRAPMPRTPSLSTATDEPVPRLSVDVREQHTGDRNSSTSLDRLVDELDELDL